MLSALFALVALGCPAKAERGEPPPIPVIIDTRDGQALRLSSGQLIYFDELSAYERDALSLGDPRRLEQGAVAEARRDVAAKLLRGCKGNLKCWRLGMSRWEAAGQNESAKKPKKDPEAESFNPDVTEPGQLIKVCDGLERKKRLTDSQDLFYQRHCKDRPDLPDLTMR